MDFFRNTADLFELMGNDTFMGWKITGVYFGDSFEHPPLKKGELGGFSKGDKKNHLATLVQKGDFQASN